MLFGSPVGPIRVGDFRHDPDSFLAFPSDDTAGPRCRCSPLGCGTTNTDRGLTGGGAVGAVVGTLAAGPKHALGGALIGGAAGAALGGVAGAAADNSEKKAALRAWNQHSQAYRMSSA